MVTDEIVEKALNAALKADIIPADDPKHSGVRVNEYLYYTPAEAVELGVHLTQKTEDGKPRWHGFTDIMGDEYDDTNRAILRPVIRAALEAALSAAEPQPAPSVAVKALEWEEFTGSSYQRNAAKTPFGEYVIELSTGQWWNPGNEDSPYTSDDPKGAAQADYEARIRAALSAQVKDVAVAASPADQIIGQIEELFPNWRIYRDLVDCITCEIHDLRQRAEGR